MFQSDEKPTIRHLQQKLSTYNHAWTSIFRTFFLLLFSFINRRCSFHLRCPARTISPIKESAAGFKRREREKILCSLASIIKPSGKYGKSSCVCVWLWTHTHTHDKTTRESLSLSLPQGWPKKKRIFFLSLSLATATAPGAASTLNKRFFFLFSEKKSLPLCVV